MDDWDKIPERVSPRALQLLAGVAGSPAPGQFLIGMEMGLRLATVDIAEARELADELQEVLLYMTSGRRTSSEKAVEALAREPTRPVTPGEYKRYREGLE